ncbi:hypothetical protein JCM10207_002170 [Rhodosporidiobolus poonsookiae]
MPAASPIPLIDLSANPSAEDLAADILRAVSSIGFLFFKVPVDGDLSRENVRRAFAIHKAIFDSPLDDRLACARKEGLQNGYLRFSEARLAESKGAGDLKESFNWGTRHADDGVVPDEPLPPSVEPARAELDAFHAACFGLVCQILDAFSIALNLPKDFFRSKHFQGGNTLALINYPPVSRSSASAAASRASVHKDWGSVTLLFQEENGTPGLEVFLPDGAVEASTQDAPYQLMQDTDLTKGTWHSAPVIPGTVLVNLGLALEGWTGGIMRATLHQVMPTADGADGLRGRRSIAYFANPRGDVVLNPISADGTIKEDAKAKTMKEFLEDRIKTTEAAAAA